MVVDNLVAAGALDKCIISSIPNADELGSAHLQISKRANRPLNRTPVRPMHIDERQLSQAAPQVGDVHLPAELHVAWAGAVQPQRLGIRKKVLSATVWVKSQPQSADKLQGCHAGADLDCSPATPGDYTDWTPALHTSHSGWSPSCFMVKSGSHQPDGPALCAPSHRPPWCSAAGGCKSDGA